MLFAEKSSPSQTLRQYQVVLSTDKSMQFEHKKLEFGRWPSETLVALPR